LADPDDRSFPAEIKKMCCNTIIDNPLRFFKDKAFNELSSPAIKALMDQTKINCSDEQLRRYILQWLRHQLNNEELSDAAAYERLEIVTGVQAANFTDKQFFNIRMDSFGQFTTAWFTINRTVCHPNRHNDGGYTFLHGIGFYTGVELVDIEETVHISLMERRSSGSWLAMKTMTLQVKQQRTMSVVNFMFEKIKIRGQILIDIDFGTFKARYCVKKTCEKRHDHFNNGCKMFSYDAILLAEVPYTCVAYLLCSDEPPKSEDH
jgi:BTB And C-terminal Kelch